MDAKGCWWDDVFVEHLWGSAKYGDVYLRAYDGVSAARRGKAWARTSTSTTRARPHLASGS